MNPQEHDLRQLFHQIVFTCYDRRLGLHDAEISTYVADLLTEFCRAENLYRIHDAEGRALSEIAEMLTASDPVHGTAASFDEERAMRKHIGDYALFLTGMYPESMHLWRSHARGGFLETVEAGKESYSIVAEFNLFEYAEEAPFFARMASSFESCIYGLNLVRGELDRMQALPPPKPQPRLM